MSGAACLQEPSEHRMNSDGNYAYLMGSLLKQKVLSLLPHRDGGIQFHARRPCVIFFFICIFWDSLGHVNSSLSYLNLIVFPLLFTCASMSLGRFL